MGVRLPVICALLILAVAACCAAVENTVWQIGKFDNSYDEFAIARNYAAYSGDFGDSLTFKAGQDAPAQKWPFIQPGTSDAWAGYRKHPQSIVFDLSGQPAGTFTLTIDFVNTHYGGPPLYEVSINGRAGTFRLPAGASDDSLADPSKGKEYVLSLPLPASYFQPGENKITLTSLEGSWVLYDALKLANDPAAVMPAAEVRQASLTPTILFVQDGGTVKQVAKLSVETTPGTTDCSATVTIAGKSQTVNLMPNLMGAAEQEVYLDELSAPTTAEVTVTAGGKSKTVTSEIKPQKKWRVYVQDSTHVDIGYTDWQERIVQRHNDNMSLALDLCARYPDFKWNTEAAWVEDNYLSLMPKDRKAEFIKLAKEGRIGCQSVYGNMLTGICSHESFIRDLYYARNMSRKYGIPYDIAMTSDVPTQVWTFPTVLAGAGVKYLSAGLNLTRGDSFNQFFDKSPLYWQGPDGAKVLTWFAPGYGYAHGLGLTGSLALAGQKIEGFLRGFDRPNYPYDAVLAFGGFGDNQPMDANLATTVHAWNEKYAYPKVILCRGPEFFSYVESNFKDKIPTYSGDGGVYWEDGAGSSANETSLVRQAKETLAASEKLYSLTSTLFGVSYPKDDIYQGWKNSILYDEHTWGAHCSISQPQSEQTTHQWEVKARFATDADAQAKKVGFGALDSLAASIKRKDNAIIAFNPLSWAVSDWVVSASGDKPVVAYAENVPPLGYKVLPVPVKEPTERQLPPGSGVPILENRFYRVEFDPITGGIKCLYDKDLKRELVDQSAPYRLNQYIYTLGRQGEKVTDIKDITREGITSPVVFNSKVYDIGQSMRIKGAAKNTEWTTVVILYNKSKRIDFINSLNKQETTDKEAGYFAFPFALNKPEWYVELPDGVVRPRKDMLPGGDMSWYCLQDFAAASDGKGAVVWTAVDSPLLTLGDINRDTFKSPLPIENGHLYAYAFNNYWFTNYKASQGGQMLFRYSLTSMPKYDPVAAVRFGQSVRNPLMAQVAGPNPKGKSAVMSASFCLVDAPNIIIQAVKQAESGKGIIIRLREVAGKKTPVVLTLPAGKFKEAWSCNLVEDAQTKLPITAGKVRVTVGANGLATVLVK